MAYLPPPPLRLGDLTERLTLPVEKNKNTLYVERLAEAGAHVVRSFDLEYIRIPNEISADSVFSEFSRLYHDCKFYAFFTARNIDSIVSRLWTDERLRDFLLDMTDRTLVSWDDKAETYIEALVSALARTRKKELRTSEACFINHELLSSVELDRDTLSVLLENNLWLACLYLLLMNYSNSAVYQRRYLEN